MEFTANQIAGFLNGTIEGDPTIKVSNLSKIEDGHPGTMTFLANPKYVPFIYTTHASVVVVNHDFIPSQPVSCTLIRVTDSYSAFASLLAMFNQTKATPSGISSLCFISPSAKMGSGFSAGAFSYLGEEVVVGDNVYIHPQVYVGNHVIIGDDTVLYPGVRIYADCVIGKNCTLHSGVIIGSDGFGFAPHSDNLYQKIPQVGNVILEDNVEVGSNTTIDRATMGSTILHTGVKLDNLIQVAHNVEIGENTVIAAQSGISGSTRIGKNCMIGGQVGIVGHIVIADEVKIGAGSGVEASIPQKGAIVLGAPAIEIGKARRNFIYWRKLDEIVKKVYALEKQINKSHE
ncbi:MAG: UDP-3-O-(3-hydroxymyristoyl)glucosamine N-acyltransferase [Bacteroidales bacterium]|nr:UDP-3-O-(3-hydroxymyristoyl)glucosamine N-acyltransferase [Bacteroidales bacterium]